jgi:DNA-binding NarL/FixJ family response regulator
MAASPKIRIFIVDDHTIFRQGLTEVFRLQPDMQAIGDAGSLKEAAPLITHHKPDVLLLDLRLPDEFGLDLLRQMKELSPTSRTVVLTGSDEPPDVVEAMRLGARGFVQKHCATELLLKAIRKVHQGEIWLDNTMTESVLQAFQTAESKPTTPTVPLSVRERQILQLVVEGCKNREIATRLFISEKTVKNHLSNIFEKMGVSDRVELAVQAMERKILDP